MKQSYSLGVLLCLIATMSWGGVDFHEEVTQ